MRLLITEATYVDRSVGRDGVSSVEKARRRGHIHAQEIGENAQLFAEVGHLLLVHFSDKYSVGYVEKCVAELLPEELRARTHLATLLKARSC